MTIFMLMLVLPIAIALILFILLRFIVVSAIFLNKGELPLFLRFTQTMQFRELIDQSDKWSAIFLGILFIFVTVYFS